MKPKLLKFTLAPSQSFSTRQDFVPHQNNRWHYHREVELIYFQKGHGTQFVGDQIQNFKSGDLLLIGTMLPHYWRFDEQYFNEPEQHRPDVLVTHFNEDFWGRTFIELPENRPLKLLLERARFGLQVMDSNSTTIGLLLHKLNLCTEGPERIMLLIEALQCLANSECRSLSSIVFNHNHDQERDRVSAVFDYTLTHFKTKIRLADAAEIARVSQHSFCRFFKLRTGKTYSRFLLEIRVGHACKLLMETPMSVKEVCYESGFNNFASFHKYFKEITGMSPLNYQRKFLAAS